MLYEQPTSASIDNVSEPTSEEEPIYVCTTIVILRERTTSADLCTNTLWHMPNLLMQFFLPKWVLNLQPDQIRTPERDGICTCWANSPETFICRAFMMLGKKGWLIFLSLKYPLLFCPILFVLSTAYMKSTPQQASCTKSRIPKWQTLNLCLTTL